jgi:hypothetical protein
MEAEQHGAREGHQQASAGHDDTPGQSSGDFLSLLKSFHHFIRFLFLTMF